MPRKEGFSIIELVLVIVVLGFIGFSVFYAIDNRKPSDENTKPANQSTVEAQEEMPVDGAQDVDSIDDAQEQLLSIELIDLDKELDTSKLDAELDALL